MTDLAQSLETPVPQDEIEAAAVETEATQETPEGKKPEKQEVTMVPHQALHEEREKRKELQRQIQRDTQERQQRDAILQQRLDALYQAQNPGPQYRDPETDADPIAALAHNQRLSVQQMQALAAERANQAAQSQQEQRQVQMVNWAMAEAAKFQAENPDFSGAYQHMAQRRKAELEAMGMAPVQVAETIKRDELWVIQSAAQTGQNPAEIIYRMAKNTGYKAETKADGTQKMENLQKGLQASKTLGAGGSTAGKPTPEQIANMSDDEFSELKKSLEKKGQRLSDVLE